MKTVLHTVCLTGAALLVIGAFLVAGSGPIRSTQRSEEPTTAAAPLLVSMQDSPSSSRPKVEQVPLSNAGFIGVSLDDAKGTEVLIKDVFPAGPAAFAGVRAGDVLLKVGGAPVESRDAAQAAIERLVPQRQSSLTVRRQGKAMQLKVIPESLAEFRQRYVGEMLRRDPRDPKYGQRHGVSEADMHVELIRRLFEQHQRMESSLHELTQEVQALRKEVRALQK
jgi:membrane-associated protease RseP (regulator of RpoE activity)